MLRFLTTSMVIVLILSGCSSSLYHESAPNPNAPTTPAVSTQVGPSVSAGGGGAAVGFGIGF